MPEGHSTEPERDDPASGSGEPADVESAAAGDDLDQDVLDSIAQDVRAELVDARQRALRAQAELENFRKRMRRESEEQLKYAALPLLRDLLSVVDNLDRAISAAEQAGSGSELLDGVRMVAAQLAAVLQQHHCRPIPAAGEPFDPNLHEAIAQDTAGSAPPGTVTDVASTGYQLHDRVVRPSQVRVAAPPPDSSSG